MPPIANGLIYTLAIAYSALAVGSSIRLISLARNASSTSVQLNSKRRSSLLVWWILLSAFALALVYGRLGLATLFCVASLLSLYEFQTLFNRRSANAPLVGLTLLLITLVHYLVIGTSHATWSVWGFPFVTLAAITTIEIATGQSKDYLRTTAGYYWAAMLIVFGVSHAVMTIDFSAAPGAWSPGSVGWCIYLVILTETNDIAQALIGRILGKHQISPVFSPGKTREGLIGGVVVTVVLAIVCAPWLTTLTLERPIWLGVLVTGAAGIIISLAGFLGDVNISGLKREAGVKDSGTLLPGMGGMLDRIDSLTYSAPAFYYFVLFVNQL
jgi:phosphatidate cytidylyltransferase